MATENGKALSGRIEGGIDAIVVGAGVEGLAAAALLGRARLKTVLVDSGAELGGVIARRACAEGAAFDDGEHLIWRLDPALADELDLYRFGVEFAARRLDTVYLAGDGARLVFDGDLARAAAAAPAEAGAAIGELFNLAAALGPLLRAQGGGRKTLRAALDGIEPEDRVSAEALLQWSAVDFAEARMLDAAHASILAAEAALRSGAAPGEAFGLFSLVERWSGEAAGLQGAVAYPKGGTSAIVEALRRACQSAQVDIRASTQVSSILIEKDRVAGVALRDGGQMRAPVVVSAIDAQTTFGDLIGPAQIDPAFSAYKPLAGPQVASAMAHLLIEGTDFIGALPGEGAARYLYAPRALLLDAAFAAARNGEAPADMIIEAVFPDILERAGEAPARQRVSIIAHPVPLWAAPDKAERAALLEAIIALFKRLAPEAAVEIAQAELRLPSDFAAAAGAPIASFAAPPSFARQWARAGLLTGADGVGGLYFCGPEAQLAPGLSGAAGRCAARRAIAAIKRGEWA